MGFINSRQVSFLAFSGSLGAGVKKPATQTQSLITTIDGQTLLLQVNLMF